ncbi:MAG: hypothetical protein DDT29_01939 [Dehalococcoidia bacterium]|nr:hypothetical protein [Bacillota bacterium]
MTIGIEDPQLHNVSVSVAASHLHHQPVTQLSFRQFLKLTPQSLNRGRMRGTNQAAEIPPLCSLEGLHRWKAHHPQEEEGQHHLTYPIATAGQLVVNLPEHIYQPQG